MVHWQHCIFTIYFFNLKFEHYEKQYGFNRQSDQVADCCFGDCPVLYTRNFRNSRNNTLGFCRNLHPYKFIEFLPFIPSFWNQHPEKEVGRNNNVLFSSGGRSRPDLSACLFYRLLWLFKQVNRSHEFNG